MTSLESAIIAKLVELARNPTKDDLSEAKRMLEAERRDNERLRKQVADHQAGAKHITELFEAAGAFMEVHGNASSRSSANVRLRAAIKAAAQHVDLIPF